jgi:predicted small lipoprotein YifL
MKKKLCRITALLLAAVLSLGGCGQPGAGKKRTDSTQQTEETKIKKKISQKVIKKGRRLTALPMSRQWI